MLRGSTAPIFLIALGAILVLCVVFIIIALPTCCEESVNWGKFIPIVLSCATVPTLLLWVGIVMLRKERTE